MQVQGLSNRYRGHGDGAEPQQGLVRAIFKGRSSLTKHFSIGALMLALSACSTGSDGLGIAAANAAEPAGAQSAAADSGVRSSPVTPPAGKFGPTAVGQKATQFRADFEKLKANTQTRSQQLETIRSQTVANVNSYHTLVGAIRSRLQMGSTPGNPELLAQWSQAQTQLTQIDADISTLN